MHQYYLHINVSLIMYIERDQCIDKLWERVPRIMKFIWHAHEVQKIQYTKKQKDFYYYVHVMCINYIIKLVNYDTSSTYMYGKDEYMEESKS